MLLGALRHLPGDASLRRKESLSFPASRSEVTKHALNHPVPPISGKTYSNWRVNLSLEGKLKQVTMHLIWAWKVYNYCTPNLCVTCTWFVSLGTTFIPSYILLRCSVSVPRFSGKFILKKICYILSLYFSTS